MVSDTASRKMTILKKDLTSIVLSLEHSQLIEVLSMLVKQKPECAARIHDLALQALHQIKETDVAEAVYHDLCRLTEDDYYEQVNRFNGGSYVDPYDLPYEMIVNEVSPYTLKIQDFRTRKLFREESVYVIGVLNGLYLYDADASRWFSDYLEDFPYSIASTIYASWISCHPDEASRLFVSARLHELCPDWDFQH
ncbi:MAG: hypothetical protein JXK93_12675 [Sphaerochaetaceae bacterium]|nr:hypothetical protein [Sphaerochaetaceae bacterium]